MPDFNLPNYISLYLSETDDGTPVLISAPAHVPVTIGDVLTFSGGKQAVAQRESLLDQTSEIYQIIDSIAQIYPAESVSTLIEKWNAKEEH